ncbi:MAG: tryptophan--tRNA ligase [Bacteroides sp.]|nr:MAG: tryptophan--tRNA ligase [Bacteroides sp.]
MKTLVSGIRPNGNLHIGHYFGILNTIKILQNKYKCYCFIANIHSLNNNKSSLIINQNIIKITAQYLSIGLDPKLINIYLQSSLKDVFELYYYLNINSSLNELNKIKTFKENLINNKKANLATYTYPILMASDILLQNADYVLIGKDQRQNLEITRKIARRFNAKYNTDFFKIPNMYINNNVPYILSLDGINKMGKSLNSKYTIYLSDDYITIENKIKKVVTNSNKTKCEVNNYNCASINNLFNLMKLFSHKSTYLYFMDSYKNNCISYYDMKIQLSKDIYNRIKNIQYKTNELINNKKYIIDIIKEGAYQARKSASKNIKEIRNIIGVKNL